MYGRLASILVRVDAAACAFRTVPCLPLIRAVQVDVEQFTASESVAAGEADYHFRTVFAARLAFAIRLDVEVVGLVEDAIQVHVEDIAGGSGVARSEGERGGGE